MNNIDGDSRVTDFPNDPELPLQKRSKEEIRLELERLDASGELEVIAQKIIQLVSSKTSFFDDIYSVGFKLNNTRGAFSKAMLGKRISRPAFVGPKIRYKKRPRDERRSGYQKKNKAVVFDDRCTLEDVLAFLSTSKFGIYPASLQSAVHEATHLDHHLKEEKAAGVKLPALFNGTVNEALARRAGDIPYHLNPSPDDLYQYIRTILAVQSEEDYQLLNKNAVAIDEKMVEWLQAFDIIDSLAAEGMTVGQIAEWLVARKVKFNKVRRDRPNINEIDFYLEGIAKEFPEEDREAKKQTHQEESQEEFKKAQALAIGELEKHFTSS